LVITKFKTGGLHEKHVVATCARVCVYTCVYVHVCICVCACVCVCAYACVHACRRAHIHNRPAQPVARWQHVARDTAFCCPRRRLWL